MFRFFKGNEARLLIPAMALDDEICTEALLHEAAPAQPTFRSKNLNLPTFIKRRHCKGGSDAVCKTRGDDLMVDDIVVASVDATTPSARLQPFQNFGIRRFLGTIINHAEPATSLRLTIKRCMVTAAISHRTTIGAASRRTRGCILWTEMCERTVRRKIGMRRVNQPC